MQFRIKNFSGLSQHPDYRWDSEYLCFEPFKNKALKYVPIGAVLTSSQYGVSIEMNEEGTGTKIYRMNEIGNILCDRSISKYAELSPSEIGTYKLQDRDVLFNRTNSQAFVGRTGLFRRFSDENIVFASYLIRVNPDPTIITPEYLAAFLNTKHGMLDVRRRARISINQSNVNAEELKRVEIPIVSSQLQCQITSSFNAAFNLIEDSETKYDQAQDVLLSELGLADWKPQHRLAFVKDFSDTRVASRIDAEYFQPKYIEIEEAIRCYKHGYTLIKDAFMQNKSSFQVASDQLYKYVEIGSIDVSNGEITHNDVLGKDLPANAKHVLKEGDVIVSKVRTYRGAITIVPRDVYVGSGAFCILRPTGQINKETLLAFLRSKPLLDWSLKPNRGTEYPVIVDDDILSLPIPLLPTESQAQIKQKVAESFSLRQRSNHLLHCAKRAVEMAIEQDETTAIGWLDSEINTRA